MLIFIDDSGDPGFKFSKGSSFYFVICLVIFDDNLEAEKASITIKELRRELKLADFIAGSINAYYSGKDKDFLETFKNSNRIEDIWEFK